MGILGTGIGEGLVLSAPRYPWARDLYDQAVANTWFPNEIQLGSDIADLRRMSPDERHAVTFLMSYFNPNELLVNKALAFGVYPYVSAPEAHCYLAKQMWEEANHCMAFDYVLSTFDIDRDAAFSSHLDVASMAAKEAFQVRYIHRMTGTRLDVATIEGKRDFVRNLVAFNVILEGIWFYSGFMVALSFRQRNLLRNFGALLDWVVRDESLHLKFGINLILTVLEENPDIATDDFADEIRTMIIDAVTLEETYNAGSSASTPTTSTPTSATSPTAAWKNSASPPTTEPPTPPGGWPPPTTPPPRSTSSKPPTPPTKSTPPPPNTNPPDHSRPDTGQPLRHPLLPATGAGVVRCSGQDRGISSPAQVAAQVTSSGFGHGVGAVTW